jgi:hypothetical protein
MPLRSPSAAEGTQLDRPPSNAPREVQPKLAERSLVTTEAGPNTYRLGSTMPRGAGERAHDALRSMLQPPSKALMGWPETGPLYDWLRPGQQQAFCEHIAATYKLTRDRDVSYVFNQLRTFCVNLKPGDRVVIADG